MNSIRFNSVLNPDKYGYEITDAHWDACYRQSNLFSYAAAMYETFGDGQTQHTPIYPVSAPEHATDWMLSLASHLHAHPEVYDFQTGLFIFSEVSRETVEFLMSIKKPVGYYSVDERRVSKNDQKRFDKRWHVIPEEPFNYYSGLERLVALYLTSTDRRFSRSELTGLHLSVAEHSGLPFGLSSCDRAAKWLNEDELEAARELRRTLLAFHAFHYAKKCVECAVGNHLRAKQATATQAAA